MEEKRSMEEKRIIEKDNIDIIHGRPQGYEHRQPEYGGGMYQRRRGGGTDCPPVLAVGTDGIH